MLLEEWFSTGLVSEHLFHLKMMEDPTEILFIRASALMFAKLEVKMKTLKNIYTFI